MQQEVVKSFLIKFGMSKDTASFQNFDNSLKKTTAEAQAFSFSLSKMFLGIGAMSYLGVKLFDAVEKTADGMENLNKLSIKLNTSATQIEKLSYIASLTHSSAEAAQSSLEGLARSAGNVFMGTGRFATKIFKDLHISVKDANGQLKDTSKLMAEVGDKVKGMQAGQQIAVLSKLGIDPSMLKTLTEDTSQKAANFDKLYGAAGINLDDAAKSSEEFLDNMRALKYEFGTIAKLGTLTIMKDMSAGVLKVTDVLLENLPTIKATLTPILNLISTVGGELVSILARVTRWASFVVTKFNDLNKATNGALGNTLMLTYALSKMGSIIKHGPLAAVVLLIGGINWLIDDYKKFQNHTKSTIDWNGKLGKSLRWIGDKAKELAPWLIGAATGFYAVRTAVAALNIIMSANPIGIAIKLIGVALFTLLPLIIANWDSIKKVFTDSIDYIVGKIDWLIDKLKGVSDFASNLRNSTIKDLHLDGKFDWMHHDRRAMSPAATSSNHTIQQSTTIHVHGSSDAQATANAVAAQQGRVNGDMQRNMQPVTR